ncbi:ATP-binding protein [Rhodopseudomonas sp. G2_2311]|uniref:ATP-binding protein n=1 Tax=Rhodopseudomonas sp. G2_2311 TaxID=3114287 RepID=UPI0039C69CBD
MDQMLEQVAPAKDTLEGFDPLLEGINFGGPDKSIFEEATQRVVQNILKSYTGYFDIFSELIQNSLDACDKRSKQNEPGYSPKLYIKIDIANRNIRVVDNGVGMSFDEAKFCFRPNVSFKSRKESRGHKGVGATFLAYGYGQIRLFTKTANSRLSVRLVGGRQWADDQSGSFSRPKLEADNFDVSELAGEASGTAIEISIPKGVRPDLGWWGATTATQWYWLLRMRTPLGGIYLAGAQPPKVKVNIEVNDYSNSVTQEDFSFVEYPYPHELSEILPRVRSYEDVVKALSGIEGDSSRIPQDLRRIDAIWGIWDAEQILRDDSPFAGQRFEADQQELIRRHNVSVYGCFLSTAKSWKAFQVDTLRIRKEPLLMKGGLLVASDFMIQGDPMVIPLTSTIGYQAATHVVVHFVDGNPDMGRKVFQPELKALAEDLSRQVVNIFKRYLYLMREDTGAANIADETETYHWLEDRKSHRVANPLEFAFDGGHLAYTSIPQSEQDVIAVFHELVGMEVVKGVRFLGTNQQTRYDGCYVCRFDEVHRFGFNLESNPLGVNHKIISQKESRPLVLEYKLDLDGLISDFAKEIKFQNEINCVVCWSIGDLYHERYALRSYMIGEEGASRQFYGATHSLWYEKARLADVVCLRDLIRFFSDPEGLKAEHKTQFRE